MSLRALLLTLTTALCQAAAAAACGEVVTVKTHAQTEMRYTLGGPADRAGLRGVLVLMAGGEGYLKLDDQGCPQALGGNSLLRSRKLFHAAGYLTAMVDAPSDHHTEDGLAGFRVAPDHAQDLGRVIAGLRERTSLPVWIVGTSRGTISAANAASRLGGPAAPDGVVLTSALMSGSSARKPWVLQTVFDLPLDAIRQPVLVMGHEDDKCQRSPPGEMGRLDRALTGSARHKVITLKGGPGRDGPVGLAACEGRSPHGFVDQEAEMVQAIVGFIAGN